MSDHECQTITHLIYVWLCRKIGPVEANDLLEVCIRAAQPDEQGGNNPIGMAAMLLKVPKETMCLAAVGSIVGGYACDEFNRRRFGHGRPHFAEPERASRPPFPPRQCSPKSTH